MEIDEPFDIDNIDIEEQMNEQDIQEEEEEMINNENEAEIEKADADYKKSRMILNAKNLAGDLSIKSENLRTVYFFKKDGVEYKGYVVHKVDKNNYIFNAKEVQDKDGQYKLRKFNITVLKQIVNKHTK